MKRSHRIWRGLHAQHTRTRNGTILRAGRTAEGDWPHPWSLDLLFEPITSPKKGAPTGEWRAYVEPGFVNGRDTYAAFSPDVLTTRSIKYQDFGINPLTGKPFFSDPVFKQNSTTVERVKSSQPDIFVPLTNDPRPFLVLDGWRDPAASAGIAAAGDSGSIIALPGEGYPKFFDALGVMPAAKRGSFDNIGTEASDPARTRQIRAMDVVLRIPRMGTRIEYTVLNNLVQTQTERIDYIFTTDYYNQVGGRAILFPTDKISPPDDHREIKAIFGQNINVGEPEYDDLLIATAYMVSPAQNASAEPDSQWEAYVQYREFWNLNSATRVIPQGKPQLAIKFFLPLAGGLAQPIFDSLIFPINDIAEELAASLFAAQAKSLQWSA